MTSNHLPTSLSDIQFHDPAVDSSNIYRSLKSLRTSTLSIPNRLRSILSDSLFVQSISAKYQIPLIANERCGSWYISPNSKAGSAYFKSTDGHFGQWDFSPRRLNLQVLDLLEQHGGAVIVDSTRRGKWMPDALMKTVPIWCCVINRACFPDHRDWHGYQWPRGLVGEEEATRIEVLIPKWVEDLKKLNVADKMKISKPLKCFWAMQEQALIPEDVIADLRKDFHAVVLCSASRRVHGAEMSEGGYIQGAGDDSEGWSYGLTPDVFWNNQETLLAAPEETLPELIAKLTQIYELYSEGNRAATLIKPTGNLYVGTPASLQDLTYDNGLVINCQAEVPAEEQDLSSKRLDLGLNDAPGGKLGSRDLRKKLYQVKDFVTHHFQANKNQKLLVICSTGKNLSVGVALVILCLFFDNDGRSIAAGRDSSVDKTFIRQRLAWITLSKPEANPSRSTLQAVNSFLFDRP